MKFLPTFLLVLALGSTLLANDLQRVLSEAQTAMLRGDIETAERNYRLAYQMDSRNPVAIGGLKQVAIARSKGGGAAAVEKQLSSVIIPQVQFKEATFSEALDFLKKKVTDLSGGKQSANFVVQPGVDQGAKITLSLTNIPLTEAMRYLAELVSAKVEYQQYAIVIRPSGGVAPAAR
ncbi:MAG: hypothetical protein ABMA13_08305 [Chthoniobacteraceae bacterium]